MAKLWLTFYSFVRGQWHSKMYTLAMDLQKLFLVWTPFFLLLAPNSSAYRWGQRLLVCICVIIVKYLYMNPLPPLVSIQYTIERSRRSDTEFQCKLKFVQYWLKFKFVEFWLKFKFAQFWLNYAYSNYKSTYLLFITNPEIGSSIINI